METYQPQEDLTVSMTKITLDKSESMQECSEHPKEKVMFHCLEPSCTYFNIQDLYCLLCSQDRHPHKIMPIELHRKNIGDQWNIERQNVRVLISNIREMLEHFSDLVTIFEELIPDKKRGLKSVEMRLECLGQEMEDFYQENVAQLINSNNVVGLQQQNQKFNNFKEKLEDFDILREPTAKVFWKIYSDHVSKVTIFDSFYKLKPQSMTLLLKLQMQRVMLALLQLRNMVILDQFEQLQESDGPAMLFTLSLQKQMLDQFDTSTASQNELARVAQLRSDLDIIGMAFIMVRQQQQFTDQIEKLKVELDQRQQPLLKDYYFVQQSIVETRGNQETKGELATSQIVSRPEIAQSNTAGNEEEKKEGILTPTGYTPDRPQISKSFDSLILDSDKQELMNRYFAKPVKSTLLFRGSRDSFQAKEFHKLCDKKGPTLVVIKTKCGHIIGGYTTQSWDGTGYKTDTSAWIFNTKFLIPIPVNKKGERAIYCYNGYGPSFGDVKAFVRTVNDIQVSDNSNLNNNSFVQPSQTYDYQGVQLIPGKDKVNFSVEEMEVFLIE